MGNYGEPWTARKQIESDEDHARARTCVNALAGMEPSDIPLLVGLMRRLSLLLAHRPTGKRGDTRVKRDNDIQVLWEDAIELLARLPG